VKYPKLAFPKGDEGREYKPRSERDLEQLEGLSVKDVLIRGRERDQRL
jgi:hypothetical protein